MLLGELHLMVHSLQGLSHRQCNVYLSFEVDSYRHFFRKGKTKMVHQATEEAKFNQVTSCFVTYFSSELASPNFVHSDIHHVFITLQEIIMDLDGSQTLRILFYEEVPGEKAILRGKATFELNAGWLSDKFQEKSINLQEVRSGFGLSEKLSRRVTTLSHIVSTFL